VAVARRGTGSNYLDRSPNPSGLVEVLDLILDKGLVIDAYVRVSVVGIELLTIDARIVIASVDTYLRFAEAVNRLDLPAQSKGLTEAIGDPDESGAGEKTEGAVESAAARGTEKLDAVKERGRETVERAKEKVRR
jgi:gas vesicle structural protein